MIGRSIVQIFSSEINRNNPACDSYETLKSCITVMIPPHRLSSTFDFIATRMHGECRSRLRDDVEESGNICEEDQVDLMKKI